jgi:nucleotide-binding universal stress UspA family protein
MAIRVAGALAERDGGSVHVVSVIPPVYPYAGVMTDLGLVQPIGPTEAARKQVRVAAVRDQLRRLGVERWPVTVTIGWPAADIAATASRYRATLIVVGIGRHLPVDRLLGSETALEVVRAATVPVFAVAAEPSTLPRRGIAALDFSRQSEDAARVAAKLLSPDGTLQLVHVRPSATDVGPWTDGQPDMYAVGVERRFEQLTGALADGESPRIETLVLHGDAPSELLAYANATGVDLLTVGAQRHSRVERLLLGSVAAKLLRGAHCSVLVIPAARAAVRGRAAATPTRRRRAPAGAARTS